MSAFSAIVCWDEGQGRYGYNARWFVHKGPRRP